MPVSARIVLDTRRITSKGYPIKIRIKQKYIHLNEFATPEQWQDGNVNKKHPDYRRLQLKLSKRQLQLLHEVEYCNTNNLSLDAAVSIIKSGLQDVETEIFTLKKRIAQLQGETTMGFLEFFDVRIHEKKQLNEATSNYSNVRDMLSTYLLDQDISINKVTYEWLNAFVVYKLNNGANRGGVNSYLETMRAVYKEAQRRESLGVKQDNPFAGLIKGSKKREVIELTTTDFKKLLAFNPERSPTKYAAKIQKRNVAIWLFQYVIGGHDLVDIAQLNWSQYKNGRIQFKRYKNRNKIDGGILVNNAVFGFANDVITQYGTKENARVFGFIPNPVTNEKKYTEYRKNVNRSLATVCANLELTAVIKTKSPRYLFRSKAGELLIHDLIVMQLMGHKPDSITYSYQSKLPLKVVDKAHKKIVKATSL